jgi:O-succinylbenzoic acid--CoA ligase
VTAGGAVGPGPTIAFDAQPTPEVVFTLLAAIEAGILIAPLDPRLPGEERARRLGRVPDCVDLDAARATSPDGTGRVEVAADVPPGRPLALLFSSGSSGEPKLIELSRGAFAASAAASAERLGWRDDDRWLCCLPLAHIGGLSVLIRCLLARRTVVLTDGFDASRVAEAISGHEVTLVSLVPTMLVRLLDLEPPWQPPAQLRTILLGGAHASAELWERSDARNLPVRATYGMTETCSQVATALPAAPRRLVPLAGVEFRDREGRLEVRGPMLCRKIDGAAAPEEPDWTEDGYLRTGDLGRVRDGFVEVFGRADRVIVTGGENVAPAAVERVLEGHPGIERALVFGIEDEEWGEVVVAALVSRTDRPRSEVLAAWCAERLPPCARPRRVAWLGRVPLTAAGKPDYVAVRRTVASRLEAL